MDDGTLLLKALFLLGWWIVMGFVSGVVASNKNRSVGGWVTLVLLFMPTILILLALRPSGEQDVSIRSLAERSRPASKVRLGRDQDPAIQSCAGCGAKWGLTATTCSVCGHDLSSRKTT